MTTTTSANPVSELPLRPLPLEGLRVLDATHIVAGPFCAMILADMGAEVIKIERPGSGDRARANDPYIDGPDGTRVSARYLGVNRNKKSVSLDLRDPVGKRPLCEPGRVSPMSCWTTGGRGHWRGWGSATPASVKSIPPWSMPASPATATATAGAALTPTGRPTTPASRVWAAGWQ